MICTEQVSIQIPEFGSNLTMTNFVTNFNSTFVTFSPESPRAGTADMVFLLASDQNLNASISFKFLDYWNPSVVSVKPSAGYLDSKTRIQVEMKVDIAGKDQPRFFKPVCFDYTDGLIVLSCSGVSKKYWPRPHIRLHLKRRDNSIGSIRVG